MNNQSTTVLGVMSGTSLDGLDLALCNFKIINNKIKYTLIASQTINYEPVWKERLTNVFNATAEQYFKLNELYGKFIGNCVTGFLIKNKQTANYIASHGHTVFHRPDLGFTTQIGCGATIAATTKITTICDFRSLDVAFNGQGAPLVPIGDKHLFAEYEACLNIGGIANITYTNNNYTNAFDICIANMALNYLCEQIGKPYDDEGDIAKLGCINTNLLQQLIAINTHQKSIGRELFENQFLSSLNSVQLSIPDKLATCVAYTATKIGVFLNENNITTVLVTGGGAYNSFLIAQLQRQFTGKIIIPNDETIQFKEAIIFAYLGYLRINTQVNTLSSVTKATQNSCGGCVYLV